SLPDDDSNFSLRVASIKATFTRDYLAAGGHEQSRSESRRHHRRRGVWQRKFWDHAIRDQDDLNNHLHYIHYNAVKHGYAKCPHEWPHSSFARAVEQNLYCPGWLCACSGNQPMPPDFSALDMTAME
ncbi:MAG TPA: hypothetical protein VFL96_05605, partial [Acidobacteriaceae bacterium]|nr:hypothetical protein [Acidobacteriaceae bacterium]